MYTGIETFGEVVKHRAQLSPNATFIKFENDSLTFQEYDRGGNKMANIFSTLGLKKSDTCAVMLPNSSEFLVTWLGLARLGVIEVPINVAYKGDLLAYILNKAKCQALVISSEWVDRINEIADELTHLSHIIVVGEQTEKEDHFFLWYSFEDLFSQANESEVTVEMKPTDPALILFTSGTTGPSKGAILSHRANFQLAQTACDLMSYTPSDRLFTMFPLFHVNARYTTILVALIAGCDVVMHNSFSASRFWDICREEGITCFNYMGSLLTILMKQEKRENDANNPVRMVQGAPAPVEIYEEFEKRFDVKITESYGSTEVGMATVNRAESFRLGSCGKAVSNYEVDIHDEDGHSCPAGVIGEMVVRPKQPSIMFSGYYGMPEETVKAWENLWFHTGDSGYMDEDGYFYFVDRKKDVVRRRGENISSFEIESVINKHPQILEAAVIGVPSELSEEEVLVVVTVKAGEQVTAEQLLDYCQSRMAHFAIPRYVRFVKELPRTPSQRVEKYKLRKEGVTADTWDREKIGFQVKR